MERHRSGTPPIDRNFAVCERRAACRSADRGFRSGIAGPEAHARWRQLHLGGHQITAGEIIAAGRGRSVLSVGRCRGRFMVMPAGPRKMGAQLRRRSIRRHGPVRMRVLRTAPQRGMQQQREQRQMCQDAVNHECEPNSGDPPESSLRPRDSSIRFREIIAGGLVERCCALLASTVPIPDTGVHHPLR